MWIVWVAMTDIAFCLAVFLKYDQWLALWWFAWGSAGLDLSFQYNYLLVATHFPLQNFLDWKIIYMWSLNQWLTAFENLRFY